MYYFIKDGIRYDYLSNKDLFIIGVDELLYEDEGVSGDYTMDDEYKDEVELLNKEKDDLLRRIDGAGFL